jgi:hypothetical protein
VGVYKRIEPQKNRNQKMCAVPSAEYQFAATAVTCSILLVLDRVADFVDQHIGPILWIATARRFLTASGLLLFLWIALKACARLEPLHERPKMASAGEVRVSQLLEELYPGRRFTKVRPDWLRNPETGRNLELDFYCEELRMAVEYNGRQHYEHCEYFHGPRVKGAFEAQRRRDQAKAKICASRGIRLVEVPYYHRDPRTLLQPM